MVVGRHTQAMLNTCREHCALGFFEARNMNLERTIALFLFLCYLLFCYSLALKITKQSVLMR